MANEIIPGTINGVENTTTFLTRPSETAIVISSTSTYRTYPVYIRAVCLAPIIKTEPVSFYSRNTFNGTTTTQFLGTANFEDAIATIRTTDIRTGTNVVYCTWPGQGRWRGFTNTLTQSLAVAAGIPYPGVLTLARVGSNLPSTSTFTVSSNTATTTSGVVSLVKDSIVYPAVITNSSASTTKTGGTAGTSVTTSTSSSTFIGNTVTTVINTSNVITVTTASIGGGQYSVTTSTSATSVTTEYFTINNTISTGTFNTSTNSVSLVADPATLPPVVNVPYRVKGSWEGGGINGVFNMSTATGTLDLYTAVQPTVQLDISEPYKIFDRPATFNATLVYPSGSFVDQGITVSFFDNGTLLETTSTTNNVASITVNGLTTGTHNISAVYNGSTSTVGFLSTSTSAEYNVLAPASSTWELRTIPGAPNSAIQATGTSVAFVLLTTNYSSTAVGTLVIPGYSPNKTIQVNGGVGYVNVSLDPSTGLNEGWRFNSSDSSSPYISGTGIPLTKGILDVGFKVTTNASGVATLPSLTTRLQGTYWTTGMNSINIALASTPGLNPNVRIRIGGVNAYLNPGFTREDDWPSVMGVSYAYGQSFPADNASSVKSQQLLGSPNTTYIITRYLPDVYTP